MTKPNEAPGNEPAQTNNGHYTPSCDQCDSETKYVSKAEELFFQVGSADLLIYAKSMESTIAEQNRTIADLRTELDAAREKLEMARASARWVSSGACGTLSAAKAESDGLLAATAPAVSSDAKEPK